MSKYKATPQRERDIMRVIAYTYDTRNGLNVYDQPFEEKFDLVRGMATAFVDTQQLHAYTADTLTWGEHVKIWMDTWLKDEATAIQMLKAVKQLDKP